MLSFNNLGHWGRLGNQMFQYASLKGLADKHGYEFCIPNSEFVNSWTDHQLFEVFELRSLKNIGITRFVDGQTVFLKNRFADNPYENNPEKVVPTVQEEVFHFNDVLFNNCPNNVDLFGYFQTEKYFKHIRDEVKRDLTFKEDILNPAKEFRDSIDGEVISLHIRRGDYLHQPQHPVQPLEYYKKALEYFDENIPVIVFSDDSEWVKSEEMFESDRFIVSEDNSNVIDMCLMTLCDYHIIANSSFSWWGSWLSDSKKTITPNLWFGPPLDVQKDTKDVYCEGWVRI